MARAAPICGTEKDRPRDRTRDGPPPGRAIVPRQPRMDAGLDGPRGGSPPASDHPRITSPGIQGMLHIHFGAGRLGLGLVAPYFRRPGSELYLLNRAASGDNATGSTSLAPQRRNGLLRSHPTREYFIQKPAGGPPDRQAVHYDDFVTYGEGDVGRIVDSIARESPRRRSGVVVT